MSEGTAFWAVVPAAGSGKRMGAEVPKQYLRLRGRQVLDHALAALLGHPAIRRAVVAVAADDTLWRGCEHAGDPRVRWVTGGAERCHSVLNALHELAGEAAAQDWVLVHDAARPCLSREDLDRLVEGLCEHPVGGLLGVPVRDTLKRCADDGAVIATVDRTGLWHAYTPQMFRFGLLRTALEAAVAAGDLVTDEAAAVERGGLAPRVVEGHAGNVKVTRPEDLAVAELFLRRREG
jgi:2-C-methyl-D-erythritol 4-phosphate cytidylyltransferase